MSRTNAPSKPQSREGRAAKHNRQLGRFAIMAKNVGYHATAKYLRSRNYTLEQAMQLIFDKKIY